MLVLLVLVVITQASYSQFYNGSQLTFGKNRVQYREFLWTYYNFKSFDVYFYRNGQELAIYTARYAEQQIRKIEEQLDATIEDKMQFLVFNTLSDLKQSNIGLINEQNYNTGGITHIIGRKVFLYFDGTYTDFERQIRAGIAEVVFNELMFGGSMGSQIKNSTLYSLPEWYKQGVISYLSENWSTELDNQTRDLIRSEKFRNFNRLSGQNAVIAGHSLWKFVADNFGEAAVPGVIQMTRMTRSVENGFLYVLGLSFKNLTTEWLNYYRAYYQDVPGRTLPDDPLLKRFKNDRTYAHAKISPDGRYVAYMTNEIGQYKLFLYDQERNRKKRLIKGGYRLDEKNDLTYPLVAWHPSGKILAYLVERKGEIFLYFYNLDIKKKTRIVLFNFEKVLDISYSPDGKNLLMSAVQKGQSDLYVFYISSGSHEQLTNDPYDDIQPRFIENGSRIVFCSNRLSDTLKWAPEEVPVDLPAYYDIWTYDYAGRDPVLRRVTNTPYASEKHPMPYGDGYISFLSDENGIYNRYLSSFDSAIAYVDTVTHYRYFSRSYPITNYSRSILEQDINVNSGKFAEIVFDDQSFRIFTGELLPPDMLEPADPINTEYMQSLLRSADQEMRPGDSKKKKQSSNKPSRKFFNVYEGDVILIGDDSRIDIDDYVFDKQSFFQVGMDSSVVMMFRDSVREFVPPKRRNYRVEYFINELTTQIDFSYLNNTYQPFSGGGQPIFLNPGFNALFKVGLTDLLEDYRIIGGVRLNVDLINNEYLVSFSNLKKRIDKEITFHRVTVEDVGFFSIIRNHSHELYYSLKYPFSPVLAFKATGMYRNDAAVYLSTDQFNLKRKTEYRNWVSMKGQLIYDNTRSLGLNLYRGTRSMLFGEYYMMVDQRGQDMAVVGLDIRNYQSIHRNIIWANRFAASTSFGNNKLIYYMGGVDNWLVPKFTNTTPIDYSQNYAYQTVATNMRGFRQNIRNGNSFVLFNTEIRWPVFKYFFNRPIKSDFLNNFQVVGFGDIGTAWTGWDPYSEENSLFRRTIRNGSLLITVEEQKDPIVAGYGFGLRSRLLGYFLRGDLAWGVEDGEVQKPIIYISLSLDF